MAAEPSTAWLRFVKSCSIACSLALAELAGLRDLLGGELHFIAQGLGNGDLPAGHGRTRIQPLLQVGFVYEESLFEAARRRPICP